MEITNTKVAFIDESIIASGFPMTVGDPNRVLVTDKDMKRAKKLAKVKTGTGHDTYLKGIIVQFNLKYPEYLSPQLQRYNWVDIVSSQSKMHRILSKGLTQEDFAKPINKQHLDFLNGKIKEKNFEEVINNLPLGYMKWMRVSTNYLQLKTIYYQRKNHKLQEWKDFCNWIEKLPLFKELVL